MEECFLDLRLLDAAATTPDLEHLFGMRLAPLGHKSNTSYGTIVSEQTAAFHYEIRFQWSGSDAEHVIVDLSNAEKGN